MEIGTASVNVQIVLQKLLTSPVFYDKGSNQLRPTPGFKKWSIKSFPIGWYVDNLIACVAHFYCVLHLIVLYKQFHERFSFEVLEEIISYAILAAMCAQCMTTWYTLERDPKLICFICNNIFKMRGVEYVGWPNKRRLPVFKELIVYGVALGFLLFPLICATFPWLRSLDPASKLFAIFLPEYPRRVCATMVAAYLTGFGAVECGGFLGIFVPLIIFITETACLNLRLSRKMIKSSINGRLNFQKPKPSTRKCRNQHSKNAGKVGPFKILDEERFEIESPMFKLNLSPNTVFRDSYTLHTQLALVTQSLNENLCVFVPILQGVGLVFCIFSNWMIVSFHELTEPAFCVPFC